MKINLKRAYLEFPYLRPLISTLVIYLVFVYLLTFNPFHFSLHYLHQFLQFRKGYLAAIIGGSSITDIILNLIMLFPLGFVLGSLLRILDFRSKPGVTIATVLGFLVSFSIEFCQIFLPRSSSGIDIVANTLGSGMGAWLSYPLGGFDPQQILNQLYIKGRLFYSRVIIIYCIVATLVLLIPVCVNDFSNWSKTYHLLIGNEGTLNRPWRGVIYKLTIFNRTLEKQEVKKLYALNFQKETPAEFSNGLLTEYIFDDLQVNNFGILRDSLVRFPSQQYPSNIERNGMMLKDNSLVKTKRPATELVRFLQNTNHLSIAIWFQPQNLQQAGPARIVSLSKDPDFRNFTLGQSGSMLNFRARTLLTGLNGSKVELITSPILTKNKPQFIIVSFYRGESRLFYNGQLASSTIYNTSYYLPLLIGLGRNRFGKIAFCFMLLFPLGWLARGLVKSKVRKSIVSGLIVIVPFLISSLITTIYFHQTLDLHLFYICCFISFLLLVIGLFYSFLIAQ